MFLTKFITKCLETKESFQEKSNPHRISIVFYTNVAAVALFKVPVFL